MRRFRPKRRPIAALGITVLAAAISFMFVDFASAAPTNASAFRVGIAARLELADPSDAPMREGADLRPIGSVSGTVDSRGAVEISTGTGISLASSIDPIDRDRDTMLQVPLDQVRIDMPLGFRGTIDAAQRTLDLVATGATYNFLGLERTTFACATVPIDLHLRATDYNAKTGTATLVSDPALMLPPLADATPTCDHSGVPTGADIGVSLIASTTVTPRITPQAPIPPATTRPSVPPTRQPSGAPHGIPVPASATNPPGTTSTAADPTTSATGATTSKATGVSASRRPSASTSRRPAAARGTTPTTAYVWRGGAGPDLYDDNERAARPPTVGRPTLVPQPAATRSDADGTRFGIVEIAVIAGGVIGGVALLRSEARRLLRRRPRASF